MAIRDFFFLNNNDLSFQPDYLIRIWYESQVLATDKL